VGVDTEAMRRLDLALKAGFRMQTVRVAVRWTTATELAFIGNIHITAFR
jgi:hypothetical protein